jgi:glycosyltransferase involved in cell wall biosynthesis
VPHRAAADRRGTRLKILTSWAMGKPIVPTSIGCEGVAAVDGDNILIRDEPREFAKAVLTVLADPTFGRRLGERSRMTVEQFYSWEVIGRELNRACLQVANVKSTPSASAPTTNDSD